MSLRFRLSMLLCLIFAAFVSGYGAYSSIRQGAERALPQELYDRLSAEGQDAEYFLRPSGGYVGIYTGSRARTPLSVTGIELSALRGADRALIEKGIPVASHEALLYLLEDLGS